MPGGVEPARELEGLGQRRSGAEDDDLGEVAGAQLLEQAQRLGRQPARREHLGVGVHRLQAGGEVRRPAGEDDAAHSSSPPAET